MAQQMSIESESALTALYGEMRGLLADKFGPSPVLDALLDFNSGLTTRFQAADEREQQIIIAVARTQVQALKLLAMF